MKALRFVLTAAVLATLPLLQLRGSMPSVPTGEWAAAPEMAAARRGAASAPLPDGSVLVSGGAGTAGATATAEIFGTDGQFTAAGDMGTARADHASVLLADGRVLVAGGRGADGPVASAETFGPDGWTPAGSLTDARWGHTATRMDDGRVLIAGGEGTAGPLATLEIFDPVTGTFSVGGSLTSLRSGHAAAPLPDGRVAIAGGRYGDTVLASIDLFDPLTGSVVTGPSFSTPRAGLSATTLADGTVLFAGGSDGTQDLPSAEIFDPAAGTMTLVPAAMTPRSGHQAFLLPLNNAVLLAGGTTAGAPTASAELYLACAGVFRPTGSMTAARAHAFGAALSAQGRLLVAGGDGLATSELYGFATITTDRDDYYPGLTVTMTGSGWQPGETVTLLLRESTDTHDPLTLTAVADVHGRIVNTDFVVEPHDLGVRFYLTATGAASQAQATFTDAKAWTLTVSPATTTVSTPRTYTFTVTNTGDNNQGSELGCATVTVPSVFTSLGTPALVSVPPGKSWSVSRTGSVVKVRAATDTTTDRLVGAPSSHAVQFSITATAPATTTGSPFTWTSAAFGKADCGGGNFNAPSNGQPVVAVTPPAATTTTASAATATFAGSAQAVPLAAAVTSAASVNGGTVSFTIRNGGAAVGVPAVSATVAAGAASATYSLPGGTPAGSYVIDAQYSGAPGFAASGDTAHVLTVGKASQAITFTAPGSKTYGDAPFGIAAAGGASGNPVTFSSITPGVCTTGGSNGATVTIAAAGTCSIKASQAGNGNYEAAPDVTRDFSVNAKTVAVTPSAGQEKPYSGNASTDPVLTYALAEPVAVSGALARAAGEDAGVYAITFGSLASTSPNYDSSSAGRSISG